MSFCCRVFTAFSRGNCVAFTRWVVSSAFSHGVYCDCNGDRDIDVDCDDGDNFSDDYTDGDSYNDDNSDGDTVTVMITEMVIL